MLLSDAAILRTKPEKIGKPDFDLYVSLSFIYTNVEAFTIFSATFILICRTRNTQIAVNFIMSHDCSTTETKQETWT